MSIHEEAKAIARILIEEAISEIGGIEASVWHFAPLKYTDDEVSALDNEVRVLLRHVKIEFGE